LKNITKTNRMQIDFEKMKYRRKKEEKKNIVCCFAKKFKKSTLIFIEIVLV
jgi:hypothetical protein